MYVATFVSYPAAFWQPLYTRENTQQSPAAKIFFCESDSCLEWASAVNYSSLISLLFRKFQSHCWGSEMQPRGLKGT